MLKVCLTGTGYTKKHFADLSAKGFKITHHTTYLSPQSLSELLPEYDAYVLGGDERLTDSLLQNAKKLRMISFVGTGYTSFIDESAALSLNISIKNTPSVMAQAVAEHTIGFIIGMQRKLFEQNWLIKNNCSQPASTQELASVKIGIVGMGEIGTRIAKILRQAFNTQVIYHSRSKKPSLENELNLQYCSMTQLFSTADIIVFSLPTNPETEYFVNDALLENVKPGVILINTAGARLIDPFALKKYIENNKISSVAFDGYYIEPLPQLKDDPYHLLSLTDHRFVVTPHSAAKTQQSWDRMIDMAVNNVINFFHE